MTASGDEDARQQLRRLGEYLIEAADDKSRSIGEKLGAFSFEDKENASRIVDDTPWLVELAKREYNRRALRTEFFARSYFGEPAWDILLDLFVTQAGGYRVSVTSACIASRVAATTALRWLAILEKEGLILRRPDHQDKRREWIEITELGHNRLRAYLRAVTPDSKRQARSFGAPLY